MLYHLLYPLHTLDGFSFLNVFRYITFRAAYAAVTSLVLVFLLGPPVINWLREKISFLLLARMYPILTHQLTKM